MNFSFLNLIIGGALFGLGYLVLLKADVINNQVSPFAIGPKDIHGVIGYKLTGMLLMVISVFIMIGILNVGSQFEARPSSVQSSSSSKSPVFPNEKNNGIAD